MDRIEQIVNSLLFAAEIRNFILLRRGGHSPHSEHSISLKLLLS